MRRPLIALAAAALLALGGAAAPALAQDFPPAPPIGDPKPFAVPASETYTLANGMQVTLLPYGVTPKTVLALELYAGALNEGGDTWLSDITAEMLRQGAGDRSAAQLATAAADMGGDLDTGVSGEVTSIGISVLSDHAADAVALIADVARRPAFPEDELARVKANWERRLAVGLSQPAMLAEVALARAYYGPDHPYGRVIPTRAQLAGYTIADVRDFHRANYGAKRARLYVAGQFDPVAMKAAIERAFGDWASGPDRAALPPEPTPGPRVILVDRPDAPQSTIRLAFPAPEAGSAGDIPLRVSNALLGGSFSSRITRNIREDKGYTYSPRSAIRFAPDDALWTFNADVTTAVTGASLKEVFHEIRTLQGTAPPAEEAAGMRNYLAGLFVIRNATPAALLGTLAERDALGLPEDWLQSYVPAVLEVTPQQIQASAGSTLPLDKMTLVVVGDLAKVEPQLTALPELKGIQFQRVTVP